MHEKKKFLTFLNDSDGISQTDYLCVLISVSYIILLFITVGIYIYDPNEIHIKHSKLFELFDLIQKPFNIVVLGYFAKGFVNYYISNTKK